MIKSFLFQLLEISALVGIIILVLLLFAHILNKRYVAKWKCAVWFLLAVRLLLPINFEVAEPLIQIELPVNVSEKDWNHKTANNKGMINNQENEDNQSLGHTKDIANTKNDIFSQEDAQYIHSEIIYPLSSINSRVSNLLQDTTFLNYISHGIFIIWLIGALIFALYHSISYRIYRKNILRWGSKCTNKSWLRLVSEIAKQMHLKRIPDIVISKNSSSPMILGLVHPKLIMPKEHYTEQDLIFIFNHELTHYKRKDVLYKLVLLGANAMHWFNPAVYLMFREASGDLECSCDDRVMENISAEGRRAYTEIIFNYLFRQKINERSMSTYFYGGKKNMKNRFENIMNTKPKKQGRAILIVFLCTCLCIGNLVGCSSKEIEEKNVSLEEKDKEETKITEVAIGEDITNEEKKSKEEMLNQIVEEQNKKLEAIKKLNTSEKAFVELVTSPPVMQLQDSLSSTLNHIEVNADYGNWNYNDKNVGYAMQSTERLSPLNPEKEMTYLKFSCLCSQLSFIFGHPSPSTSMYFALFPYFFPCEESIREKVFFSS